MVLLFKTLTNVIKQSLNRNFISGILRYFRNFIDYKIEI